MQKAKQIMMFCCNNVVLGNFKALIYVRRYSDTAKMWMLRCSPSLSSNISPAKLQNLQANLQISAPCVRILGQS